SPVRASSSSFSLPRRPPSSTLFPYTTLFRSRRQPRSKKCWPTSSTPHAPSCCRCQTLMDGFDLTSAKQILLSSKRSATANAKCRSEEHTSELQSRVDLVCRLLLEKKKQKDSR